MSAGRNTHYLLCPKCGYPNKPESLVCGFCQKDLHRARVLPFPFSGDPRERSRRRPPGRIRNKIGRILLSGSLLVAGGYLFYFSLRGSEFQLWLVSLLCFLYGLQLVRPFLRGPLDPPQ